MRSIACEINGSSSIGSMIRWVLPDSSFSSSRISLTRRTKCSVLSVAILMTRVCLAGCCAKTPELSKPRAPLTEVKGVRSSWLTTEINSSFIFSIACRSVTSSPIHIMPIGCPCISLSWALFQAIVFFSPALVRIVL